RRRPIERRPSHRRVARSGKPACGGSLRSLLTSRHDRRPPQAAASRRGQGRKPPYRSTTAPHPLRTLPGNRIGDHRPHLSDAAGAATTGGTGCAGRSTSSTHKKAKGSGGRVPRLHSQRRRSDDQRPLLALARLTCSVAEEAGGRGVSRVLIFIKKGWRVLLTPSVGPDHARQPEQRTTARDELGAQDRP